MKIFLFLCSILIIFFYFYKMKKLKKEKEILKTKETLVNLRRIKDYPFNSVSRELEIENIKKINLKVDKLIEDYLEKKINFEYLYKEFEVLSSECKKIEEKTTLFLKNKNSVLLGTEVEIRKFKDYIDKNNFYPQDFLFKANDLEANITDLKNQSNLEIEEQMKIYEKNLNDFYNNFKLFKELHEKVNNILEDETLKIENEKKEKMIFDLQSGKLNEVKNYLESISNSN